MVSTYECLQNQFGHQVKFSLIFHETENYMKTILNRLSHSVHTLVIAGLVSIALIIGFVAKQSYTAFVKDCPYCWAYCP